MRTRSWKRLIGIDLVIISVVYLASTMLIGSAFIDKDGIGYVLTYFLPKVLPMMFFRVLLSVRFSEHPLEQGS